MREVVMMDPSKLTKKKLRWQCDVAGVKFFLYIPQWRVPYPWPRTIRTRIYDDWDGVIKRAYRTCQPDADRACLEDTLTAVMFQHSLHRDTVRFTPIGAGRKPEIGDPYIPYGLLDADIPDVLRLEITWEWSAGTWLDD